MNMNDVSDIIKEFQCCTKVPPDCKQCPQKGPGKDKGEKCRADVVFDVVTALKAFNSLLKP